MKPNYSAWDIDLKKLQGTVTDVLKFAVLAPSSHNSQPWGVSAHSSTIEIALEPTRLLPVGDPEDRFSTVSVGCAVENACIAAEYFGYSTTISFTPKKIIIELQKSGQTGDDALVKAILSRVTNRGVYDKARLPPQDFIDHIPGSALPGVTLTWVAKEKLEEVAKICVDAAVQANSRSDFRRELSEHVRSNITHKHTGIPGFGLGIPTPPSLLGPHLVRYFNMSKVTAKKDFEVLSQGPLFGLITTGDDAFESRINAGRLYEHLSLTAMGQGMRTAVWGAPIVEKNFVGELSTLFGVAGHPQLLFRLGYPLVKDPPHSPRLPSDKVVVQ